MPAREITLDACDLEPPEPYELTTGTLKKLQPGEYVRLLIPRHPRLLYPWLAEHGFREITRRLNDDLIEVFIWAGGDTATAADIDARLK